MLSTMLIKNLAVIREMDVQFAGGLNVLTGETGAGKSILMDALQAILGARVSKEIIRADAKSTLVEVAFFFPEGAEPKGLEPYLMDGSLVISREIFRDGRNVVKLNGSLSNTAILRGIAPYLISIHSQNDNQILFNEELHYLFLDKYAGSEGLLNEYQECYQKYKDVLGEISRLEAKKEQDNNRVDYLKFVVSEIESANLLPDEEENLKTIKSLLKNQEKNQENIQTATYALYENEESAYNYLSVADSAVRKV
ncbi:MAG: AAA family ATPase, partial [Clostridia bacterium]|nr:AAA family ATPase [Clostridia bacterium]